MVDVHPATDYLVVGQLLTCWRFFEMCKTLEERWENFQNDSARILTISLRAQRSTAAVSDPN